MTEFLSNQSILPCLISRKPVAANSMMKFAPAVATATSSTTACCLAGSTASSRRELASTRATTGTETGGGILADVNDHVKEIVIVIVIVIAIVVVTGTGTAIVTATVTPPPPPLPAAVMTEKESGTNAGAVTDTADTAETARTMKAAVGAAGVVAGAEVTALRMLVVTAVEREAAVPPPHLRHLPATDSDQTLRSEEP